MYLNEHINTMRKLTMIVILAVFMAFSLIAQADDQDIVLQLRQAGEVMPLEQILTISRQQQPGRILEIELEQERDAVLYELKILAEDGQVWELKVDAKNGTLLKRERD